MPVNELLKTFTSEIWLLRSGLGGRFDSAPFQGAALSSSIANGFD